MAIIYFEGAYVPEEEARIPVSDRGFQHGDGAYATIQVRDGAPLFLEAHLEQLAKQCRSFNLLIPQLQRSAVEELVARNHAYEGIWRLKIFITGGDSLDNRLPERHGRAIMLLKPFTPLPFKPLKLGIFPIPYWSCHAAFKSLAHLNRFYVMEEAHKQGLDDCITQTESGYVLEAAFGNLIWIQEKTVFTPDPSLPLYLGITLTNILHIARSLGFHIEYVKAQLSDIPDEATLFRTNTMQGIRPVAQIAERTFAQNSTLQTLLINGYADIVQNERKKALLLT